jgi:hypothetical protein
MLARLAKPCLVVCLIALVWLSFYQLNSYLFHHLKHNSFVNWVFVPHGVRLVCTIIFAELAILGLFLGTLLSYHLNDFNFGNPIILALISGFNPYFAVRFSQYWLKLDNLFSHLNARRLIIISLISAIFNSVIHQFYLHMRFNFGFANDALIMFAGDFFGALLLLYLMSLMLKIILHKQRKS